MNAPLATHSSGLLSTPPAQGWTQWRAPLIASTLVLAIHVLALGALLWTSEPQLEVVNMPTISGSLVAPPPSQEATRHSSASAPPTPQSEPAKPAEPTTPEPPLREEPVPDKPAPEPTPPSETTPPPEPVAEPVQPPEPVTEPPASNEAVSKAADEPSASQSAPSPEAPSVADDALDAPVTPPRADAAHLNNPAPVYPRQARRLRQSGVVLLEVLIMPDGSIGEIRIEQSSGFERLDEAALEAVHNWRYVPASRAGQPIPYWYLQPIEFSLN